MTTQSSGDRGDSNERGRIPTSTGRPSGQPRRAAGRPGGGRRFGRRRVSYLGPDKDVRIDYKDIDTLLHFIGDTGKIESAKKTGNWPKVQRRLRIAIQRARHMALLPYAGNHARITSPAPDRTGQSQPAPEEPAVPAETEEGAIEEAAAETEQQPGDGAVAEAASDEAASEDSIAEEATAEVSEDRQLGESEEGASSVEQSEETPERAE
ncbi:MAG: 30S ribosomal protein S18 [Chloroflexota bacterium]